jgi:hypothetical protein
MAKRRATFGKLQRERDKQQKAAAKRDRRLNPREDDGVDEPEPEKVWDEQQVMNALARLHEAYDNGEMGLDDFEERRAELQSRLQVE